MLLAVAAFGQQAPPTEGARDLFFVGAAPKDELPAIAKTGAPPAAKKGAVHLGMRYTLLLVTASHSGGEPVDPTRNFRKGDCVAMELESNRSGYLYVLAKESGGDWTPLYPAAGQVESNKIDPGQVIRTPKRSCFEIEDPPGTETLFVVLSREPRDISQLADSVKLPSTSANPTVTAKVNSAVESMDASFGTRDLPFKQVVKPEAASAGKKEPPHAVYVVTGSSKPASTLVTKVEIHHQ